MTAPSSQVPPASDGIRVTPEVLSALRERIQRALPQYAGVDADRAQVRLIPFHERSSYPLYEARVHLTGSDAPAARFIVKFAPVFPENNEGLTEFRHLAIMTERLGVDGPLRVPRAHDFYADLNALVMERVGGERFSRALLANASWFSGSEHAARLSAWATMCGRWLREFHAATARDPGHPFGETFLAAIERRMTAFAPLGFPADVIARVRRTAAGLHAFGQTLTSPVAGRHGDYGPQNIHVADDHIFVFDLNYPDAAVVYEDVVYFLVTLETLNPYPRQWFFSRGRVAALRDPFLRGYLGASPDETQTRLLAGYYLKALLFRASKQRRNVGARGTLPRALFDRFRLRGYYARRVARQCDLIDRLLDGVTRP